MTTGATTVEYYWQSLLVTKNVSLVATTMLLFFKICKEVFNMQERGTLQASYTLIALWSKIMHSVLWHDNPHCELVLHIVCSGADHKNYYISNIFKLIFFFFRFYYDDRNVILVSSSSKFYQYKPESRYLLTVDNVDKNWMASFKESKTTYRIFCISIESWPQFRVLTNDVWVIFLSFWAGGKNNISRQ